MKNLVIHVSVLAMIILATACGDDDNAQVGGCTDPLAANFNPGASIDDGSCSYNEDISCVDVDFTISVGQGTFNGSNEGVAPGDVIGIEAGTRERIIFQNIVGTAENPVVIVNCGGRVILGGPNVNNGIIFQNSSHFRIAGIGDANSRYGIFITETEPGSQGIVAAAFSTNLEIDHVEIQKAGFAGIMVKTDPSCDPAASAERGPNKIASSDFVMRDINIHDNYIHDISGEGIYLGNSFYAGTEVYGCGLTQYPHEVRNVRVNNNVIENTGWESIQVGAAIEDVMIFENTITNYGTANNPSQNGGIQVGVGTTGDVFNNMINGGTGPAIFVQGIGDNLIFNNIIRNAGSFGIIISNRPTPLASDIVSQGFLGGVYIINNTIINSGDAAIKESVNGATGNVFYNNLIVTDRNDWDQFRGDTEWQREGNLVFTNITQAGFTEAGNLDFSLTNTSGAVNAGVDVSSFGISFDFERNARPQGAAFDVGALESGN